VDSGFSYFLFLFDANANMKWFLPLVGSENVNIRLPPGKCEFAFQIFLWMTAKTSLSAQRHPPTHFYCTMRAVAHKNIKQSSSASISMEILAHSFNRRAAETVVAAAPMPMEVPSRE